MDLMFQASITYECNAWKNRKTNMKTQLFILSIVTAGLIVAQAFTVNASGGGTNRSNCSGIYGTLPQSAANVLGYHRDTQAALANDRILDFVEHEQVMAKAATDDTASTSPALISNTAKTMTLEKDCNEKKSPVHSSFILQTDIFAKTTDIRKYGGAINLFSDNAIISIGDRDGHSKWEDNSAFNQFPFDGAWANRDTGELRSQPDGFQLLSWTF